MPSSAPPALSAPAPIDARHEIRKFGCGKSPLNDWLRNHALGNAGRASRCFVVRNGQEVAGFTLFLSMTDVATAIA